MKIVIISKGKRRTIRFPLRVVRTKFVTKRLCKKINDTKQIEWNPNDFHSMLKRAYKAIKKFSRAQEERFVLVDICSEDSHIFIYI